MLIINEHTSQKYTPRTYYNGKMADVTLALAVDLTTPGEISTKKGAGDKYIGFQLTPDMTTLDIATITIEFMKNKNAKTLNIAGNGIYTLDKHGCSQEFINEYVLEIISTINSHIKIDKIYTGGQTGVDLAGAIAGKYLNIETEVTMPKGYLQRNKYKVDEKHTEEEILNTILNYCEKLKFKI